MKITHNSMSITGNMTILVIAIIFTTVIGMILYKYTKSANKIKEDFMFRRLKSRSVKGYALAALSSLLIPFLMYLLIDNTILLVSNIDKGSHYFFKVFAVSLLSVVFYFIFVFFAILFTIKCYEIFNVCKKHEFDILVWQEGINLLLAKAFENTENPIQIKPDVSESEMDYKAYSKSILNIEMHLNKELTYPLNKVLELVKVDKKEKLLTSYQKGQ